jgi:hypothetical protein
MEYKFISKPWLIQRGTFRDISDKDIAGLDSLICYDYMGSSEFEFGALPKALKNMTSKWENYIHFQIDSIQDCDGQYLQVLCQKNKAEEIKDAVTNLFNKNCTFRLKEFTGMYDYLSCRTIRSLDINFWWDVSGSEHDNDMQNSWMCCFGDNIRRLIIAIRKVWWKHNCANSADPLEVREPGYGPDVPAPITKPKPSQLIVNHDRTGFNITVVTIMGNKTVINKRNIISYEINDKRLLIKVKTRSGDEKWLKIDAEPSSSRKVLENILIENIDINKYSKALK